MQHTKENFFQFRRFRDGEFRMTPPRYRGKYLTKTVGRAPKASAPQVSRTMRSNKSWGTRPEVFLGRTLRKKILRSDLPGKPDFVFPRAKLAIFVHGCFWHRCPECKIALPKTHSSYWKKKLERNVERDRLNKERLSSLGWKVLEIWEHTILEDPKSTACKIKQIISARKFLSEPFFSIG